MIQRWLIIIIFCTVIIGAPTGAWALGLWLRGQCCPWPEFVAQTLQVAPIGVSLGVIAALVVNAYERLLRAIESDKQ